MTDTRDETADNDHYLLKKGRDVFGWYTSEFRVRRRVCQSCDHAEVSIELLLEDLDKAIEDARQPKIPAGVRQISTRQLIHILDKHRTSEDALSHLLSELLYRRGQQ